MLRTSIATAIALLAVSPAQAAITATLQLAGQQIAPSGAAANTFYIAGEVLPQSSRGQTPQLFGCAPAGAGITTSGAQLANCATYFDSGFYPFDLGASAGAGGDPNGNNMIQFQLTSTSVTGTTTGSTAGYEVVVFAYPTAGASSKEYVPIGSVNGVSCSNGGSCYTVGQAISLPTGGTAYYAASFTPGTTVTIGLYTADMCWSSVNANPTGGSTALSLAVGCTSSAVTVPSGTASSATGYQVNPVVSGLAAASTAAQMQIEFDIFPVPTTGVNTAPTGSASDASTGYLLNFQGDTPTMVPSDNCPGLATSYQPGDGQIFVNSNLLSLDIANQTAGTAAIRDINHAPPQEIIVASVKGPNAAAPNVGATPSSALQTALENTALGTLPPDFLYGGTVAITGFDNITANASQSGATDANTYQLQFMVRDSTGMVAVPLSSNGTGGCTLSNVETSAIQGFLAGSKCFIATGAFRSGTVAPVMLLRAFRDQVLLHSSLGQGFVHWYYGWSPPAALWLVEHPIFRFPVLLALVPLEGIAWLALHPAIFLLIAMGALSALALGGCVRLGRRYE